MTENELRAIRAAEKAATPGPWDWIDTTVGSYVLGPVDPEAPAPRPTIAEPEHAGDAAFITLARSAVPALLQYVAELEGLVHDLSEESTAFAAGQAEGRREVLELLDKAIDEFVLDAPDGGPSLDAFIARVRDRGPVGPHQAPADVRAENERLRQALRMVLETVTEPGPHGGAMCLSARNICLEALRESS